MADDGSKDKTVADEPSSSGLAAKERWLAGLIGLAGVVTGGIGIFLSDNQAGTTAILLLGAVFLLMGVQGTAITKAGKDSVELERRRVVSRRLASRAEELADEGETKAASELAEAARTVDPSVRDDPNIQRLEYRLHELETYDAVKRVLATLSDEGVINPDSVRIEMGEGSSSAVASTGAHAIIKVIGAMPRVINIEPMQTARSMVTFADFRHRAAVAGKTGLPYILVSNQKLHVPDAESDSYSYAASWRDPAATFVLWRHESDDGRLAAALRGLIRPDA